MQFILTFSRCNARFRILVVGTVAIALHRQILERYAVREFQILQLALLDAQTPQPTALRESFVAAAANDGCNANAQNDEVYRALFPDHDMVGSRAAAASSSLSTLPPATLLAWQAARVAALYDALAATAPAATKWSYALMHARALEHVRYASSSLFNNLYVCGRFSCPLIQSNTSND